MPWYQLGSYEFTDHSHSAHRYHLSKPQNMRVAVVGAGASGLVMIKELLDGGHDPVCFEASGKIGGVYNFSYPNTIMTTSSHMTAFSDFPPKCDPTIWSADEYVEYLQDYAAAFDLMKHVRLQTPVKAIQRLDPTAAQAYWTVVVETSSGEETYQVDNVVISTGTNNKPKRFKYEGQETFEGEVIHSHDVTTWSNFDGARVVVVGMGESGADVALEVAMRPRAQVAISIRKSPGWIVPRYRGPLPADMMTNRLLWGLPRRMGSLLSWILCRADAAMIGNPVIRKMGEINASIQTTSFGLFGTIGTKSSSGVEAIVRYGALEKPDIKQLGPGKLVTFADGSQMEADFVLQCTGFQPNFSYLRHKTALPGAVVNDCVMERVADAVGNVRRGLYKHAIHPELGLRLMFQGFIRPGFGALPPLVEMQARWYVSMLNGSSRKRLPPSEEMRQSILEDAAGEEFVFRKGPGLRVAALVDHVVYFNDLASLTGCMPPWLRLLAFDPRLLWKVITGPHSGAQFRLVGPGAKPELARDTILSYPGVFFPIRKLAFISAGLWLLSSLLSVLLLPIPAALLGGLRGDLHPIGFANSREAYNRMARLKRRYDAHDPVLPYNTAEVPVPVRASDGLSTRRLSDKGSSSVSG